MAGKTKAIILAAGLGARFTGHYIPKQFVEIDGKPILVYTLEKIESITDIDSIVLVINPKYEQVYHDIIRSYGFSKISTIIFGGETRQESVCAGIKEAEGAEFVMVHNGVCPLTPLNVIRNVLARARETREGVSAYIEVVDTIVRSADGKVGEYLDRSSLVKLQAPQAFPLELIRECHDRAIADGIGGVTNDAHLVTRYGHTMNLVRGSFANIKVTTTEDWMLARVILRAGDMGL